MIGLVFFLSWWSAGWCRYENVNVNQDWWENAVVYQVYPRSFADSDGDGVGDINGIASRLEYLKDLGVDAALIAPIFKSPMLDYGFDISDHYAVSNDFGTMKDFDNLLRKAAELNIKVLLDFAPNHVSNASDWFTKSAGGDEYYADWFIWESGHVDVATGLRRPPNNWISLFSHSAWSYVQSRDQFYFHQFSEAQPDLNYRNPVLLDEIKNIIKFWLEKGVAGFRMNAVNHIVEVDKDNFGGRYPDEPITGKPGLEPKDYGYLDHIYTKDQEENYDIVSQFRDVFDAISLRDNTTRIMITEAHSSIKNAVRYFGEGHHSGAQVPLNYGFMDDLDKDSDARDIKFTIDKWLTYKPLKKRASWVTGNHDISRVASRFGSEHVDTFNMLVLLLPGISFTYMGEELGMVDGYISWGDSKDLLACKTDDPVNYVDVSRDSSRTPFQWNGGKNAGFSSSDGTWLPIAEGFESLNLAQQRGAARSHYHVYRTLAALKKRPAFRLGRYESLAMNKDVFAFKRWYNDDAYVVVMNVGTTYRVVNLTAFDLIFGQLEVEASNVLSSRSYGDTINAERLDLVGGEALVLRMQV